MRIKNILIFTAIFSNSLNLMAQETGVITDTVDGITYRTVKIGMQTWMGENLNATKFINGDLIPNIADNTLWNAMTSPACCEYDNLPDNNKTFGKLYNWYTLSDERHVCPAGWHVPSETDWSILAENLGGSGVAGGKLKESGTMHWPDPNEASTNGSGFSALPGGNRDNNGSFFDMGYLGGWWSSTENSPENAWGHFLSFSDVEFYTSLINKGTGYSVRCIKD